MLPQPPPNAPAPPPSEAALRSQRWWRWILFGGILSIILLLLMGFVIPLVLHFKKASRQTFAITNEKEIGLALQSFHEDYGQYPCDATIAKVLADHPGTSIPLGTTSSNDYFRQLIVAKFVDNEKIFYVRSLPTHNPDNNLSGVKALQKGECAFAYVSGIASDAPPDTPLVLLPLVPGKHLFDSKVSKKYFGGKAIILHIDNSVSMETVDKSGHVHLNGKDLFDPSQPFWHGKAPDVKWPE